MLNPLKMKQQATELLKDYLDSIHARLEKMNEQMDLLILEIRENNSALKAMMIMRTTDDKLRTTDTDKNKRID